MACAPYQQRQKHRTTSSRNFNGAAFVSIGMQLRRMLILFLILQLGGWIFQRAELSRPHSWTNFPDSHKQKTQASIRCSQLRTNACYAILTSLDATYVFGLPWPRKHHAIKSRAPRIQYSLVRENGSALDEELNIAAFIPVEQLRNFLSEWFIHRRNWVCCRRINYEWLEPVHIHREAVRDLPLWTGAATSLGGPSRIRRRRNFICRRFCYPKNIRKGIWLDMWGTPCCAFPLVVLSLLWDRVESRYSEWIPDSSGQSSHKRLRAELWNGV